MPRITKFAIIFWFVVLWELVLQFSVIYNVVKYIQKILFMKFQ